MIIRIFIISLLFYSCSMKDEANRNRNREMKIDLLTTQIYNYKGDFFELLITHEISNNHFVFIKNNDVFKANILTTIQVYDIGNDSIIIQNSWKDEINEKYYEDTRSSIKSLSFNESLDLPKGEYRIKVNIQDLDNSNIFKSKKEIDLSAINGFGDLSLYVYKDNLNEAFTIKEIDNEFEIGDNDILLSFQYFNNDKKIDQLHIELDDSNQKYSQEYFDLLMDDNGFYSIDFTIPDSYYNRFDLTMSISDHSIIKSLYLEDVNNDFWTNDTTEIIAVMRYILPVSDIKALKKMELIDQFEFIKKYWSDRNSNPDNLENDLLIEFTNRVKFVNLNFSNLNKGWRSDRGRVYIIYGPPEMVERYSSQTDGVYEIWEYPSGERFTFLDRNGFGNFILIRKTI